MWKLGLGLFPSLLSDLFSVICNELFKSKWENQTIFRVWHCSRNSVRDTDIQHQRRFSKSSLSLGPKRYLTSVALTASTSGTSEKSTAGRKLPTGGTYGAKKSIFLQKKFSFPFQIPFARVWKSLSPHGLGNT